MWTDEFDMEGYIELLKIDKLGDLLLWAFEHDFYYEEEYSEYFADSSDGSDALRMVYLNLWYEDLIYESERRAVEYAVTWKAPGEEVTKDEVVQALLGLSTFKCFGVDSLEKLVDYLNGYAVNPMIRANSVAMFDALTEGGYIVNHQLIYFGNVKKEMWPDEPYRRDHLYKLNLELEPVGYDEKTIKVAVREEKYKNRCNPDDIVELDSDIVFRFGHSTDRNWVMYEKDNPANRFIDRFVSLKKPGTLVAYNVNHGRRIEYKGNVISYCDGIVILQYKNELYRVDGNQIIKIYSLNIEIPEYVNTEFDGYRFRDKRILIAPAIRGQFVPFEIDYDGNVIGDDCMLSDYIWYSVISLETILCNKEDLPYDDFCHDYRKHMGRIWDDPYEALRLEGGVITCASIEKFYRNIRECDPRILDSMWPFIKLIIILSQVVDPDTDLSELLCAIRNDYIKSHKNYWDSVISLFYDSDSDEEIIDKDILAHRINEDDTELINYKYNQFVDMDYVMKIFDLLMENKLEDYIEKIWFGDIEHE